MVTLLVVVAGLADKREQRNLRLGAGHNLEVQLDRVLERQRYGIGDVRGEAVDAARVVRLDDF